MRHPIALGSPASIQRHSRTHETPSHFTLKILSELLSLEGQHSSVGGLRPHGTENTPSITRGDPGRAYIPSLNSVSPL